MSNPKLDALVSQMENYLECLKQFNHFLAIGRSKKYTAEDENQFLEVKSVIVQELEIILAAFEGGSPSREDVHGMISAVPSLRYLCEGNEATLRGVENQWHKIYVGFQALLGQLKVKQREVENKGFFSSVFSKKK